MYKKLLHLTKLKVVAFLQIPEFPLEISHSQNRNSQYKKTIRILELKEIGYKY